MSNTAELCNKEISFSVQGPIKGIFHLLEIKQLNSLQYKVKGEKTNFFFTKICLNVNVKIPVLVLYTGKYSPWFYFRLNFQWTNFRLGNSNQNLNCVS